MVGRVISHYRILEKLGEGGMGVVYKAEDTRLGRVAALKFLPSHLIGDTEKQARFRREAQAAAALHHPNICTIYEIDEAESQTFIAMACVDGRALDEKIAEGPLKLGEALSIAQQIAEGLQEAHAHGVIHRDIKPANVMLSEKGQRVQAIIMDFGLAQVSNRSKLTRQDSIVGTIAYMSPEQTLGQEVDRRTDLWSLGVVLYEMLAGEQPFKGHYDQAVLYAISHEEPAPLTALRSGVPMELEWVVEKALAKEPADRYQSAEELIVDLRSLRKRIESGRVGRSRASGSQAATASAERPLSVRKPRRAISTRAFGPLFEDRPWMGVLAVGLLIAAALAGAALFWRPFTTVVEAPLRKFTIQTAGRAAWPAISPNGRYVAYFEEGGGLWVHDLQRNERRPIEGTGRAVVPFWSPDSEFIGFVQDLELKKAPVSGAPVSVLCKLPGRENFVPAAWSPDGRSIVFATVLEGRPVMFEVSARDGDPAELFRWDPEGELGAQLWTPHFLPSERGERLLLFAAGTLFDSRLILRDLDSGRQQELGRGFRPVYCRTGHIVYQTSAVVQELWALPFSVEARAAAGKPFPIAQNALAPTVSSEGTLVYQPSPPTVFRLVWKDRQGDPAGREGVAQQGLAHIAVSPDGARVALSANENNNEDIWVHELERGVRTRLTFDPASDVEPVWSPDGSQIAFASTREGARNIFAKPADGSGEAVALASGSSLDWPHSWSPDGKNILFTRIDRETEHDIWHLEKQPDGTFEAKPFLCTPARERNARFSPGGRFVAYISDETGRYEVHVRPFPAASGKWQVSENGGIAPRWSPDGKELYYLEGQTLVAVPVQTGGGFSAGSLERLFSDPNMLLPYQVGAYGVSPDRKRFLLREPADGGAGAGIRVAQNWVAEFQGGSQPARP